MNNQNLEDKSLTTLAFVIGVVNNEKCHKNK